MEGQVLNISPFLVWLAIGTQILNFALMVWNILGSGTRKNAERIKEQAQRVTDHDLRLNTLEQTMRGLPAAKDMHELELSIEKLQGRIETMTAVMNGHVAIMERLEAIVSRHENHLLDGRPR